MNARLETMAKGAAAAALLAYGVGLIATALYLETKLDVPLPDLAALKPRFVYTGALVLACVSFIAVPLCIALRDWTNNRVGLTAAGLVGLAVVECSGYVFVLGRDESPPITLARVATGMQLVLAAGLVGALAAGISRAIRAKRDRSVRVAFCVLVLLIASGWFLNMFTERVLAQIPDQYGGVEPSRARLLVTTDAIEDAKALGIGFVLSSRLSRPLEVMYQGDQYYVLRLPNRRVVQLAHESVIGSITDTKQPFADALYAIDHDGTRDLPSRGDRLVLSFSEAIDPASVLRGWVGTAMTVTLKVTRRSRHPGEEDVSVLGSTPDTRVNLGDVVLDVGTPRIAPVLSFVGATMTMRGGDVTITLDDDAPVLAGTILSWTPSAMAIDLGGNHAIVGNVKPAHRAAPEASDEF